MFGTFVASSPTLDASWLEACRAESPRSGEGVHVCPGVVLAGRVRVGDGAFVGMGAKVIQCRTIGEDATVGAGAVVLNDVPPCATVVGVPARVIKSVARAAG